MMIGRWAWLLASLFISIYWELISALLILGLSRLEEIHFNSEGIKGQTNKSLYELFFCFFMCFSLPKHDV